MHLSFFILIFVAGLAHLISSEETPEPEPKPKPKFSERFHISQTCNGQKHLDELLSDTIEMTQFAISAIESLQKSNLNRFLISKPNANYIFAAHHAFGVARDVFFNSLSSSDSKRLSQVKSKKSSPVYSIS
jgi:hypothetical protein